MSRQMRLIRARNKPVAYVSWAFVDEATEKRMDHPNFRLSSREWASGDRAWIVDLIAPPKLVPVVLKQLEKDALVDHKFRLRVMQADGNFIVQSYIGKNVG